MSMIVLVLSGIMAFLVTLIAVPLFQYCALYYNIVDIPDGKLKQHKRPTPYLGGLALCIGFLFIYSLLSCSLGYKFDYSFIIYLSSLSFLGLLDDILIIKPQHKFLGQFIIAFYILINNNLINSNLINNNFFGILNIVLLMTGYLLWLLTIINAFNLVDIMDGLATTLAISSTTLFLLLSLYLFDFSSALILSIFLGTLGAFLLYNKPPAKIYLGDCGSLFIGGFLGYISLYFINYFITYNMRYEQYSRYTMLSNSSLYITIISIMSLLLIPILEIICLIVIRTYKKIPFYKGSPDHYALYLKHKQWPVYAILGYSAFFSYLFGSLAFLNINNYIQNFTLIGLLSVVITLWLISIFIKKQEDKENI